MTQQAMATNKSGRAFFSLVLVLPFVLGAALYLSAVFSVFSSIPVLYVYLRQGRFLGILCGLTNLFLILASAGAVNGAVFFVVGFALAIAIGECAKLKLKPNFVVSIGLMAMLLSTSSLITFFSMKYKVNPFEETQVLISQFVDKAVQDIEKYKMKNNRTSQDLERILADPKVTKENIYTELPSVMGIGFLFLSFLNFLLVVHLNVGNIRSVLGLKKDFFITWRAPEHLVWPTIFAGFSLIVEIPYLSLTALNLFKFLLAIYTIHGLAILAFLFQSWGVRSWIRPMGYVIGLVVLLPLIISMGFFDLWFDFREKFKK